MSTKVYYIIPDDGDDEAHPNMFVIPLPKDQIKIKDVRSNFPLKKHFYHFRFKKPFQGKFIWLDCVNDNISPPFYEGMLVCKVVRVREEEEPQQPNKSTTPTIAAPIAQKPKQPQQQQQTNNRSNNSTPAVSNDLFEWTDLPQETTTTMKKATQAAAAVPTPSPPPPSSSSGDLLDFLGDSGGATIQSNTAQNMDFEWDANPFQAAPPSSNVIPPKSVSPTIEKKTSSSRIPPTSLGAEAAKQFQL